MMSIRHTMSEVSVEMLTQWKIQKEEEEKNKTKVKQGE